MSCKVLHMLMRTGFYPGCVYLLSVKPPVRNAPPILLS